MTPPKIDALAGCAAQGVGAEADPATAGDKIVQQVDAARIEKLHRTWPALAAIAGFELRRLADGRWLASRWNMSRELDEAEVPGWLAQVGALR